MVTYQILWFSPERGNAGIRRDPGSGLESALLGALEGDSLVGCPATDVAPIDGGRHESRELVWRARERRCAEGGELRRQFMVERRRALVGQREEHDDGNPRREKL